MYVEYSKPEVRTIVLKLGEQSKMELEDIREQRRKPVVILARSYVYLDTSEIP